MTNIVSRRANEFEGEGGLKYKSVGKFLPIVSSITTNVQEIVEFVKPRVQEMLQKYHVSFQENLCPV